MPFQRVPNTLELQVRATVAAIPVMNSFYFTTSVTPTQEDCETLVALAADWWTSDWQPAMSGDYVMREMYARSLDSEIAPQATDDSMAGEFGALGSAQANNVSLAVARRSGFTGRASRGRIFIAGVPENQVDALNGVNGTYAALITDALDALTAAASVENMVAAIIHRVSAGVPLTTAVVFTLVEWAVVNLFVDSQRNRLPKGH